MLDHLLHQSLLNQPEVLVLVVVLYLDGHKGHIQLGCESYLRTQGFLFFLEEQSLYKIIYPNSNSHPSKCPSSFSWIFQPSSPSIPGPLLLAVTWYKH